LAVQFNEEECRTMSMNPKNERIKSHKYRRDGAKYVCSKCKEKFFSRTEAEEHWDKNHENESPKAS